VVESFDATQVVEFPPMFRRNLSGRLLSDIARYGVERKLRRGRVLMINLELWLYESAEFLRFNIKI
jgi:hypothetical protein